mmetsp:Transcript_15150/g.36257  ORF Transcript_15150/g.36257 Transcript_15150/m.36257 type:complete len:720 (-) Transcript_15150:152-2311(-)
MSSAFPPNYAQELDWASTTCAAIDPPLFDLSLLPISWDSNNDTARISPLLRLLRSFNEDGSIGAVMRDGGAEDVRDYIQSIGVAFGAPLVIGIISLVCCHSPLWVARCCAHRCCAHSATPYSRKSRLGCGCCGFLMGVLTLCFLIIGIVAGSTAVPAVKQTLCSVDDFFLNTTSFLTGVDSRTTTILDLGKASSNTVATMGDGLSCLSATFTTGAVAIACDAVSSASTATSSVNARVLSATGYSPSDLSAAWASYETQLSDTKTLLCTTLPSYRPSVDDALTAVNDLLPSIDSAVGSLDSVSTSLADQIRQVRVGHLEYIKAQRDFWTGASGGQEWSGALLFIPHLLVLTLGLAGVLCMLRRPADKCCTVNAVGVQASGTGWVAYTLFAPLLFMVGGVCILVTLLSSDVGYLIVEVPKSPYSTLGSSFCAQHTLNVGDGEPISMCNVIEGCFADRPVSMWTTLKPTFDFNLTAIAEDVRDAIRASGFEDGPPFNATELRLGARDARRLVNNLDGVNASTFQIPPSHPQHDPINSDLDVIRQNLTLAADTIIETDDITCATNVSDVIPELLDLVDRVLDETSDAAMEYTFHCGFMRFNLEAVVRPSLQGSVRDALGAVALCLVVAGLFALGLTVAIIAMQIQLGDVGIEPGCPSICRCCCCYRPGANVKAARAFNGDSSDSDAAAQLVREPSLRSDRLMGTSIPVVSGVPLDNKGWSENV